MDFWADFSSGRVRGGAFRSLDLTSEYMASICHSFKKSTPCHLPTCDAYCEPWWTHLKTNRRPPNCTPRWSPPGVPVHQVRPCPWDPEMPWRSILRMRSGDIMFIMWGLFGVHWYFSWELDLHNPFQLGVSYFHTRPCLYLGYVILCIPELTWAQSW